MSLDIDQLRVLIDLLTEKDVAEFEHEEAGTRIRIARGGLRVAAGPAIALTAAGAAGAAGASPPPNGSAPSAAGPGDSPAGGDWIDVTSPFVGSFYRSPSPDAPAFVDVGSVVRPGQTLCIIEAMKLMNEIEAECAGTIVDIFAQNGKSVEYGQKLFRIKKA